MIKIFIYKYRPDKQTLVLRIIRTTSLQKLREDSSGKELRVLKMMEEALYSSFLFALSGVVCESRLPCECDTCLLIQ